MHRTIECVVGLIMCVSYTSFSRQTKVTERRSRLFHRHLIRWILSVIQQRLTSRSGFRTSPSANGEMRKVRNRVAMKSFGNMLLRAFTPLGRCT